MLDITKAKLFFNTRYYLGEKLRLIDPQRMIRYEVSDFNEYTSDFEFLVLDEIRYAAN